jgi:acetyl-CoA carboxylase carboxyl transferase subunit beta
VREESKPALQVIGQNGSKPLTTAQAIPTNLAVKCPECRELLVGKDWEKNLKVCQRCGHHFKLTAVERIELLLDQDSFRDFATDVQTADPLRFVNRDISYPKKIELERAKTGLDEAVRVGRGTIEGMPVVFGVMDSQFLGSSMGSVVGERLARAIETAERERTPLVVVSAGGGARMHEGVFSLMQMAKTSAALARLAEAGVPFISILTDPTTGGTLASFASLGDVILAEPKAFIGFAGPRVIEQAIHAKLPADTNSAEFVLAHGMIDDVVHRRALRTAVVRLVRLFAGAHRWTSQRAD